MGHVMRVAALGLALLAGCALGPTYRRPAVPAPETWRGAAAKAEPASLANLTWWDLFQDEELGYERNVFASSQLLGNPWRIGFVPLIEQP